MEQVKDDKSKDDETAYHHVARGEARFHVFFADVILLTGTFVFDRQENGEINVQNYRHEQESPNRPEKRAEFA